MKLLLIEDDIDQALVIKENIVDILPHVEVTYCQNGEDAIKKIEETKYDYVLSDLKLPGLNGIEVLKAVLDKCDTARLFLMSGFAEMVEEIESRSFGVEQIFIKPLDYTEFKEAIANQSIKKRTDTLIPIELGRISKRKHFPLNLYYPICFKNKIVKVFERGQEVEQDRMDRMVSMGQTHLFCERTEYASLYMNLFIPIRPFTLLIGTDIMFPLYAEENGEHILVYEKGTRVSESMLANLKRERVRKMFIKDTDEIFYQQYLDASLGKLMSSKSLGVEEKGEALYTYSMDKIGSVLTAPNEENTYKMKEMQDNITDFLESNKKGIDSLLAIEKGDNILYRHSFNVATLSYSLYLAIDHEIQTGNPKFKKIHLERESAKEILVFAGILHDIGEAIIKTASIASNGLTEINTDDVMAKHSEVAYKTIESLPTVHPKVKEIVLQHEEFLDGSGHPNKLKKDSISIFGQILSLANFYDRCVTKELMTREEAVDQLELHKQKFNPDFVRVFIANVIKE